MRRNRAIRRLLGRSAPVALAILVGAILLGRWQGPGAPDLRPGEGARPCTIDRVADGDTLECREGDRVRLLGIDAPELAQGSDGKAARRHLARMLAKGASATLELDRRPRDRFGRTLAWVRDDSGRLVNEAMIREGYAVSFFVGDNRRYEPEMRAAEEAARRDRRGLWARDGFDCRPVDFRYGRCR